MIGYYILVFVDTLKDLLYAVLVFLLISTSIVYMSEQDTIYLYAEAISNNGKISSDLYQKLYEDISKTGNYTIRLKADIKIEDGYYDTYFSLNDILDKQLHVGDYIYLEVIDNDFSLFHTFTNTFFNKDNGVPKQTRHVLGIPISNNGD
ncbi:MAG: hypothetical protein BGO41_01505 [Clostridiales bacterium 38-18]|nr:MAG: hypothetical protein BGO41_01505 [Clostridiales bacterium 38-18]